jgi:hypothetical protein
LPNALLLKEHRQQIVLTPETDFEKDVIKKVHALTTVPQPFEDKQKPIPAQIYLGEYYNCQGGWTREGSSTDSLIVVFDNP